MVTVTTKLSQKGQILVPKVLRDEYGFDPGHEVLLRETSDGILVQKKSIDVVKLLDQVARIPSTKPTGEIIHGIYEEYEERWRKSKKRT